MTSPTHHVVQLTLPADRPPWTPTGMRVRRGDRVTLLGSGFVHWSATRGEGAGAKYHLWGRVPGGEIFGCTQDTTTVQVDRDGELELCVYVGAWADRLGNLATGEGPYRRRSGALDVTAVRWAAGTDPIEALESPPATVNPSLAASERERLSRPVTPPDGWEHFLDFGPTDIFRASDLDARPAIDIHCDDDVGILRKDVDIALTRDTTIEWTWQVDELPSQAPENKISTHEYVSIAAEFDSGRDLTWLWSYCLAPVVDTFHCPVRRWTDRETHMPVRSGTAELGTVLRESRNVFDDHRRFMGPPPQRIVRVWLIAVSHFTHGLGRATFSDIVLRNGPDHVRVL
ncbi:MAG TPA: DUF3047 domain-containing protein [Pseudonocardia sp.]|nr:DUF3047 domain-containing protein [Pseudonocardia sp.]